MILVADSSALIAVSIYGGLPFLDALYGQVLVPQSVFNEVTDNNMPESEALKAYLSNKVIPVDAQYQVYLDAFADVGETDAMVLYKQLKADKLLIDDLRGRKVAAINQINTIGSLGVLLQAKRSGLIEHIRPYVHLLMGSRIYISQATIVAVFELADEKL